MHGAAAAAGEVGGLSKELLVAVGWAPRGVTRREIQPSDDGGLMIAVNRVCVVCASALTGRRSDCATCSLACRREASRFRAVLSGEGDGPYVAVDQLLNRARRRAKAGEKADGFTTGLGTIV